mgnify:CR=1 FL=1|jgi:hypothetical protein
MKIVNPRGVITLSGQIRRFYNIRANSTAGFRPRERAGHCLLPEPARAKMARRAVRMLGRDHYRIGEASRARSGSVDRTRCRDRPVPRERQIRARSSKRGRRSANPLRCRAEWMVPPPRLERGTPRSTIWCSNQLSYGGTGGRCIVARGSFQGIRAQGCGAGGHRADSAPGPCAGCRDRDVAPCRRGRPDGRHGPAALPRTRVRSRAPPGRVRLQRGRPGL